MGAVESTMDGDAEIKYAGFLVKQGKVKRPIPLGFADRRALIHPCPSPTFNPRPRIAPGDYIYSHVTRLRRVAVSFFADLALFCCLPRL